MNRLFLALDGDNAGQHIGQAVLMDDVQMLHEMSQKIEAGTKVVKDMIFSLGGQIISSGGDEMTAMLDPKFESKIEEMRQKYEEVAGFSASIGLGKTLSQAGKALIAAKLTGKNKIVNYDESVDEILNSAHESAQSGSANPEEEKMEEHYLRSTMDQDEMDVPSGFDHEDLDEDLMDEEDENEDYDQEDENEDQEFYEEDQDEDQDEDYDQEDQDEDQEFYEEDQETPEDMMEFPEGMGETLPSDDMADDEMMPDGDIPMDTGEEYEISDEDEEKPEMSKDDDMSDDEFSENNFDEEDSDEEDSNESSDFEEEEPITLEGEALQEKRKELDAEKAGEDEMAEPEMADENDSLDADLGNADENEAILQRIAANLDAFKQNKQLMDQIKQSKPELYAAMIGLLQNMIELAKMISPEAVSPEQEQMIEVPSGEDAEQTGDGQLPKQNG